MKTKLLRKMRSRITEIEFCNKKYAVIHYYNEDDKLDRDSVFSKKDILIIIRRMFGDWRADIIEAINHRTHLKRIKKRKNSSIKYNWENE